MFILTYARQIRAFLRPFPITFTAGFHRLSRSITPTSNESTSTILENDVSLYFREWLMFSKKPLFDQIFKIVRAQNDSSADLALSRLKLHLTEALVIDLMKYENKDVLSCLKIFDWAGRQPGFHHTRVTFYAMFRVLSDSNLTPLILDFLQKYMNPADQGIVVISYAIAGKCETALQVFGRMRFMGNSLNTFAYHVLLNSLVDQGYFEVAETLAKEIKPRGVENKITHSILVKSFTKQNELGKGEAYLRGLVAGNNLVGLSGPAVATFVAALCKDNQFEKAAELVEEFWNMGVVSMEPVYCVWIKELVEAGKLDAALEFIKHKQLDEGYVPDVFRYNTLITMLLREKRFEDVFVMLVEMKENKVLPDGVTMNAVLCLLCKVGRVDIAMDLYNSRSDYGFSVNYMAYNYLINTLMGNATSDAAYTVLRNAIEQGYFPGEKTFLIIVSALSKEGKQDKIRELVEFMLERSIIPNLTFHRLIWALCEAGRVDDGYWVHNLLKRLNKTSRNRTYTKLVNGFCKSGRPEIAARLLIEMQEMGYIADIKLVKVVICCICKMYEPEKLFFKFLEMLLALPQLSATLICRSFIDVAGHIRKPELALQVYQIMQKNGLGSDWRSDLKMLQSYLKSDNFEHALHLFREVSMQWRNRKLWHKMIHGLCKHTQPKYVEQVLEIMNSVSQIPSIQCYNELIKMYCRIRQYHIALHLVNNMTQLGCPVSSFIGNMFLSHALKSRELHDAWTYYSIHSQNLTPLCWTLGHLIGVFSGRVEEKYEDDEVEELIVRCFNINIFTYSLLLRRSSMYGVDYACKYFKRLCERGYEPSSAMYDTIVHGLVKDGRDAEARKWKAEMSHRAIGLTDSTLQVFA